jgi:hypothetical protein
MFAEKGNQIGSGGPKKKSGREEGLATDLWNG